MFLLSLELFIQLKGDVAKDSPSMPVWKTPARLGIPGAQTRADCASRWWLLQVARKVFIVVVFVNKGIYLLLKHCSEPKEDAEGQTFWWHLVTPICIVGMQVGWPIKRI